MKKPFFEPTELDSMIFTDHSIKQMKEIFCKYANEKLEKEVQSWVTVYDGNSGFSSSQVQTWSLVKYDDKNYTTISSNFTNTRRQAKLAFIEEIAKDPCPHRVRLNSFSWVDSKTREVLAKTQMTSHCELCGVMLVAEWKTK